MLGTDADLALGEVVSSSYSFEVTDGGTDLTFTDVPEMVMK